MSGTACLLQEDFLQQLQKSANILAKGRAFSSYAKSAIKRKVTSTVIGMVVSFAISLIISKLSASRECETREERTKSRA